jgi:hypothetical protein
MTRGSSKSRRRLRLLLGVNRKLTAVWWMGQWTVRVQVVRSIGRSTAPAKADEGAEKSFAPRAKSHRGQRRLGSVRARGRQPRQYPSRRPPTRDDAGPSARNLDRHLRACDHFYDRVKAFEERFLKSNLGKLMVAFPRGFVITDENRSSYSKWLLRWRALRASMMRFGDGVIWCSRIGESFSYWLEQRLGITLKGGVTAFRTLRRWRQEVGHRDTRRALQSQRFRPRRAVDELPTWRCCGFPVAGYGGALECRHCHRTFGRIPPSVTGNRSLTVLGFVPGVPIGRAQNHRGIVRCSCGGVAGPLHRCRCSCGRVHGPGVRCRRT